MLTKETNNLILAADNFFNNYTYCRDRVWFLMLKIFLLKILFCALFYAELDALDLNDELTPLGRILAKLPIEPRLGKMMIMGCLFK